MVDDSDVGANVTRIGMDGVVECGDDDDDNDDNAPSLLLFQLAARRCSISSCIVSDDEDYDDDDDDNDDDASVRGWLLCRPNRNEPWTGRISFSIFDSRQNNRRMCNATEER